MKLLAALIVAGSCLAANPGALEIMRRVAENQDRGLAARATWVYDQDVFVRLQRAGGKLAREETRRYVVAPTEKGAGRKLAGVEGKIREGSREIKYTSPGFRSKNADIDGALVDSFAQEINWRKDTLGPVEFLFPLSAGHQDQYTFTLDGEEQYQGFDAWRISFRGNAGEDDWRGDLLVEKNEFQPIILTSHWAGKIPLSVRLVLGVTVKQVGAKFTWRRMEKDIWFPVTAGGEMKLRVFFLYARTIAFRSVSSGFRKAEVQSSVEYETQSP